MSPKEIIGAAAHHFSGNGAVGYCEIETLGYLPHSATRDKGNCESEIPAKGLPVHYHIVREDPGNIFTYKPVDPEACLCKKTPGQDILRGGLEMGGVPGIGFRAIAVIFKIGD